MTRISNLLQLTFLVLPVLAICGSAFAFSGAGSGTESSPYIITTVEQLQEMQDDLAAWYELGNDINASGTVGWNGGEGFVPVGQYIVDYSFTGSLDGKGFSINNLYINRIDSSAQGLFALLSSATVKNVHLVNASVRCYTGGTLARGATNASIITNCSASGTLTLRPGSEDAKSGGLIGSVGNGSHVSRCSSKVDVNADSRVQVGGLIGYLRGVEESTFLDNSYSHGTVTGNGWKQGNLLGDADGSTVDKCYSSGYIKALIGFNFRNPVITNCYWDNDKGASSSSYGGTPKSTAEMMRQGTFVNWDFDDIWDIVENETYPYIREQESIRLNDELDNDDLTFTTGGDAGWFGQDSIYQSGGSSAESGNIDDYGSSWLATTVIGPNPLSLYWKVSSELDWDFLEFYIDDVLQKKISGEVDWQQETFLIPAGTHTLKWVYKKDKATNSGSDCGWVDNVVYTNSLCVALDNCNLNFVTGGDAGWFGQTSTHYFEGGAAQSRQLDDFESSWLRTSVVGPGSLYFYWKVSSELDYDFLEFYIDDILQIERISGAVDWQPKSFWISSGTHTLKWVYKKDKDISSGSDCGWVDKVNYDDFPWILFYPALFKKSDK